MLNKSAIIFVTYKENDTVIKHFNKLKNDINDCNNLDLYCVYDITNSIPSKDSPLNYNFIGVNKDIICNEIKNIEFHYYYGGNKDFYGHNIELIHLYFYKTHPEYKYYWIIEDDVVFNGDWKLLFNIDNTINIDFICSNIKVRDMMPNFRMHFETFKPNFTNIHTFNVIYRMSNRGFNLIYDLYNQGNWGMYEHFFICAMNYFNYSIYSFNHLGFVGGLTNNELGDSTLNYLHHFKDDEILIKNVLYHPLK